MDLMNPSMLMVLKVIGLRPRENDPYQSPELLGK